MGNNLHETSRFRAGFIVAKLLHSNVSKEKFMEKCLIFKEKVDYITSMRKYLSLSRVYKNAYIKKSFYREVDYIANYYKNKGSKKCLAVYKRIMSVDDTTIRRMICLY